MCKSGTCEFAQLVASPTISETKSNRAGGFRKIPAMGAFLPAETLVSCDVGKRGSDGARSSADLASRAASNATSAREREPDSSSVVTTGQTDLQRAARRGRLLMEEPKKF